MFFEEKTMRDADSGCVIDAICVTPIMFPEAVHGVRTLFVLVYPAAK